MGQLNKRISKEIRKDARKCITESVRQIIEDNKNKNVLRTELSTGKKDIFDTKDKHGVPKTNKDKLLRKTEDICTELYTSKHQQTINCQQHLATWIRTYSGNNSRRDL